MKEISKDFLEKLEFNKVLDLTAKYCFGEAAKELICDLKPSFDLKQILRALNEVNEFKQFLLEDLKFPLSTYASIHPFTKLLRVENYVLETEEIREVYNIMTLATSINDFFKKRDDSHLKDLVKEMECFPEIINAIDKILDEKGEIRPNASPELVRIRQDKASKMQEMDRQFRSIINENKTKGWLSDNEESFRNGRRVLSVPSEHKRKIRGIIHDESSTGKTAFIEPEKIIEINNDLFDLDSEEKREIYRLLKLLCDMLRPYADELESYEELIIKYDVVSAKARLAVEMEAGLPALQEKPKLSIKEAYHPLLLMKHKGLAKETIPFTLDLFGNNRLVLISGPNAGGKSICMKAVGLLQLMLQSGFLLPLNEESEFGIFTKFFADIGDEQSLEDDLSTYSSRLKNMKNLLDNSDENSLILIDEFGSGTDPKLGGAIAEAILKEMNHRRVFGVITTHYSNLKIYAFKTKGIVNGAMLFDNEKLTPTYLLKVGKPGSSFAFEIAEKSGLNKRVLKYAKHKSGKNTKAVEQLLVELQNEKKELEDQIKMMKDREAKLQRLINSYETMSTDLSVKRKKLKLDKKEVELQQNQRNTKEINKLIKEIKETNNLEKAKALAKKVKEKRGELSSEVKELKKEILEKEVVEKRPIVEGDFVKLLSGGSAGKVLKIEKGKAKVSMGVLTVMVELQDLVLAKEPLDVKSKSVNTDMISSKLKFESKIDIRGLRKDEAIKTLEVFIDKAILTNADVIRIVHGKGNGILKQSVLKKLKEYDSVSSYEHPPDKEGGEGVTIATIS